MNKRWSKKRETGHFRAERPQTIEQEKTAPLLVTILIMYTAPGIKVTAVLAIISLQKQNYEKWSDRAKVLTFKDHQPNTYTPGREFDASVLTEEFDVAALNGNEFLDQLPDTD